MTHICGSVAAVWHTTLTACKRLAEGPHLTLAALALEQLREVGSIAIALASDAHVQVGPLKGEAEPAAWHTRPCRDLLQMI